MSNLRSSAEILGGDNLIKCFAEHFLVHVSLPLLFTMNKQDKAKVEPFFASLCKYRCKYYGTVL